MRILLVDDEKSLLLTLAANLELDGFDVTTADSGQRALELFATADFDLVLSDIRMPGMNGVELFRAIRAKRPDFPVILMTAFALEGMVKEAIAEGVFTVLPKPFEVSHVVSALTTALNSPVVLVVDGEPDAASAVESLRAAGVRAMHGTEADQVLAEVRGGKVDVCVVDLELRGTSAAELIDRIKRENPTITHIAMAGRDVASVVRQAAASGVFLCLQKPVTPETLVEAVAKARARARPGASAS
jgi:DNA-binding NtrC family response regulator